MTEIEFNERMADELSVLPREFHAAVTGYAYEHGHSAGYDEVVLIAVDLIERLQQAVLAYARRIQR